MRIVTFQAGAWLRHPQTRRLACGLLIGAAARSQMCTCLLRSSHGHVFVGHPSLACEVGDEDAGLGGREVPRRGTLAPATAGRRGHRGHCPCACHPPSLIPSAPSTCAAQDPPLLTLTVLCRLGFLPVLLRLPDVALTPVLQKGARGETPQASRSPLQARHSGCISNRPGGGPKVDMQTPSSV